jgi:hypothetical protein
MKEDSKTKKLLKDFLYSVVVILMMVGIVYMANSVKNDCKRLVNKENK